MLCQLLVCSEMIQFYTYILNFYAALFYAYDYTNFLCVILINTCIANLSYRGTLFLIKVSSCLLIFYGQENLYNMNKFTQRVTENSSKSEIQWDFD